MAPSNFHLWPMKEELGEHKFGSNEEIMESAKTDCTHCKNLIANGIQKLVKRWKHA